MYELFHAYVADPHAFFEGAAVRQAVKLEKRRDRIEKTTGWSRDELIRRLWQVATERDGGFPPVHITGLGGSGSHWLSEMLNEFDQFANAGEVYFSPKLIDRVRKAPEGEYAQVIDAIHLLHMWPRKDDVAHCRPVNSAAGVGRSDFNRHADPGASILYLIRDPRDQVLSTALRKGEYRDWVAPDADDGHYIRQRAGINLRDTTSYLGQAPADLVVRYEDLRDDAATWLRAALAVLDVAAPEASVDDVAWRHSAEAIRSGAAASTGNLDLGGRARSWLDEEPHLRYLVHGLTQRSAVALGYGTEACLQAPATPSGEPTQAAGLRGVLQEFDAAAGFWRDAADSSLRGPVLYRTHDREILLGDIATLRKLAALDTVCLAGMPAIDEEVTKAVASLGSVHQVDLGGVPDRVPAAAFKPLRAMNLRSLGAIDIDASIAGDYAETVFDGSLT